MDAVQFADLCSDFVSASVSVAENPLFTFMGKVSGRNRRIGYGIRLRVRKLLARRSLQ